MPFRSHVLVIALVAGGAAMTPLSAWAADATACNVVSSGSCTSVTTASTCVAQCDAQAFVADCDGECNVPASSTCTTGACASTCMTNCSANPASFGCVSACTSDCQASCTSVCTGGDSSCAPDCMNDCPNRCGLACAQGAPATDCTTLCQRSCNGSCTAQANVNCHSNCVTKLAPEQCYVDCMSGAGVVFCGSPAQYIDLVRASSACVSYLNSQGISTSTPSTGKSKSGGCSLGRERSPLGAPGLTFAGVVAFLAAAKRRKLGPALGGVVPPVRRRRQMFGGLGRGCSGERRRRETRPQPS